MRIPNRGGELEIVQRYPWLRQPGNASDSWEITFAASAVPLFVTPLSGRTGFAHVSWVKPFAGSHAWKTRAMLTGKFLMTKGTDADAVCRGVPLSTTETCSNSPVTG